MSTVLRGYNLPLSVYLAFLYILYVLTFSYAYKSKLLVFLLMWYHWVTLLTIILRQIDILPWTRKHRWNIKAEQLVEITNHTSVACDSIAMCFVYLMIKNGTVERTHTYLTLSRQLKMGHSYYEHSNNEVMSHLKAGKPDFAR